MNHRLISLAASILCAIVPALSAQSVAQEISSQSKRPRSMKAVRTTEPIKIDGLLNEAAWASAPVSDDFMESYPNANGKPPNRTEFRILYDNNAMYVGVRMFDDHPELIAAQLARRDASGIYSDWLHVMIGTYFDHRTAYRFSVNPLGVKKDVLEYNDSNEDLNWDAVWNVATHIDSLGWVAEYRIPFSQLRFSPKEPQGGRVWDLQIMRDIARNNERDSWAPWTQQSPGFVGTFGEVTGIDGVPSPSRLELLPYVSAGLTRAPGNPADPFFKANDTKFAAGADVKYGLPKGLTLTATVNPDFGQVEVDPAVVNLSAFETFFPEKRPFFLEGADIFQFGAISSNNNYNSQQLFYSRRIGRAPEGSAYSSNTAYAKSPDQSTILGAAKVTGKSAGWTVGLLDAVTSEEHADVISTDGVRGTRSVEPRTNYLVARARRDLRAGNTVIGGMITSVSRSLGDSSLATFLRSDATVAGVDFEHAWARRLWIVSGELSGSRISGTSQAIAAAQRSSARYYQQPDADYLNFDPNRTSLTGHMGELAIARRGFWHGSIALKDVSPGFEVNDIGFQSSVDYRSLSTAFGINSTTAGKYFRQRGIGIGTTSAWNYGGESIYQSPYLNMNATFSNMWGVSMFATENPEYYDNRLTRGGPLARTPRGWSINANVNSDTRRLVTVSTGYSYSSDAAGSTNSSINLGIDTRPTSFIHLSLSPGWSVGHGTEQYVRTVPDALADATYDNRYVFANLSQTTVSMETRLDWTFTPTLTLQLYAQPFVSVGKYSMFKQLRAPRTYDFDVYGTNVGTVTRDGSVYTIDPDGDGAAPSFAIGDPNFNIRSLHGDAVLRWEYNPGSTVFFVWQQQRDDFVPTGDFSLRRDAGAIFRAQPTNVFLLKIAYWISR